MGGTDDPSNLIRLSVEEHAEAHRKLYEEHGRWQDYLAWKTLSGLVGKDEAMKEIYRQNGIFLSNLPRTEEWKRNISKSNSKPKTGSALIACRENSKKGVDAWKGKHHTEESKRKIGENASRFHSGRPKYTHRKKVYGDGVIYESLQSAAEINGVSRVTIHNRIKNEKFDWYKV